MIVYAIKQHIIWKITPPPPGPSPTKSSSRQLGFGGSRLWLNTKSKQTTPKKWLVVKNSRDNLNLPHPHKIIILTIGIW